MLKLVVSHQILCLCSVSIYVLVLTMSDSLVSSWNVAHQAPLIHRDSPSKNTGVGCHALLQELFLTQESNGGLLHCRWILYQLSLNIRMTICKIDS